MVTVAFVGDLMLGRGVNEELSHVRTLVWGTTLPLLRATDAVIANLDCAVTQHAGTWTHTPRIFHCRADPAGAVEVLQAANVRCVALANGSVLEFGEQGLFDTCEHLHAAGIVTTGAGRTEGQAASPAVLQVRDVTVAMVALTDADPSLAATARAPGTCSVNVDAGPPPGIALAQLSASCRDAGADVTVLSMRWRPRPATRPSQAYRDFAHAAIESGFDVFFGHGSHTFHGIEIHRERPIFYDAGDFIHDWPVGSVMRKDCSFIFLLEILGKRAGRVHLIPVNLTFARTDLATGEEAEAICQRMKDRSRDLGTMLREVGGTLAIDCYELAKQPVMHAATIPFASSKEPTSSRSH